MPISPDFPFLIGTCSLKVDDKNPKTVSCCLNFETQHLECYPELENPFEILRGNREKTFEVTDLRLRVPTGELYTASVPVAFASKVTGGSMSTYRTPLTHQLGINSSTGFLSFVINKKLVFDVDQGGHEKLFLPGFDIAGSVEIADGLKITGAKDHISLVGEWKNSDSDLSTALGIAIGAPAQLFAIQGALYT